MNTPLTDAVDSASYPGPAAHREALRGLCRKLEARASDAEREAVNVNALASLQCHLLKEKDAQLASAEARNKELEADNKRGADYAAHLKARVRELQALVADHEERAESTSRLTRCVTQP